MKNDFPSSNADAINDVCREQGMSGLQCALFARSFQMVDRFMTGIEERNKVVELVNDKVTDDGEDILLQDDQMADGPRSPFGRHEATHPLGSHPGNMTTKKIQLTKSTDLPSHRIPASTTMGQTRIDKELLPPMGD